jgi:shikimate 5-dehydrogenase
MKWVVLGGKDQELRFQTFSEFLKNEGIPNELEFSFPDTNDFLMELERTIKRVDQIRLQSPYSDRGQDFQNRATDLVSLLGSADAVVKKIDGGWWPENILYEAFLEEFIRNIRRTDLSSHVLVVGSGAGSRVLIAALIKLGFSKFIISDRNEDKANATISQLKKKFFGVVFEFVPPTSLMLLPGSSSILVNGTPILPDNQLLKDLYYFNFLKLPATIIDLNLIPPESPLIEEGRRIGASVLRGYEIAAKVDVLWAKRACNLDVNFEKYKEFLRQKLSSVPFDPAPYKLS